MSIVNITPLQDWISEKIGVDKENFKSEDLKAYQLKKFKELLSYAKENSRFYKNHLKNINPEDITSLSDIEKIPFTTKNDITKDPFDFSCVKSSEINRIISLETSGTTGLRKRIFFTKQDQELTIDFFANGMKTMVSPLQKVLILMPGPTPGSVGDLLKKGLKRINVESFIYGAVKSVPDAYNFMTEFKPDCIVGIPIQVATLSRYGEDFNNPEKEFIKSVLLSTDYLPDSIKTRLEKSWSCKVLNHYGMTETGFGGGVNCQAVFGYHLREADLYFEIINPHDQSSAPDGTPGEVVVTTLSHKAMPFIRYRTGDFSFFKTSLCPCGTKLRTMAHVAGRMENQIQLGNNLFSLSLLDEILFNFKDILDYNALLSDENGCLLLKITLSTYLADFDTQAVKAALLNHNIIKNIKNLDISILNEEFKGFTALGSTKRIMNFKSIRR